MEIHKGLRALNLLIDVIVTTVISMLIFNMTDAVEIFPTVLFFYYFLLELFWGQTIGKLITGTVVLDFSGKKPRVIRILIRTLLRFNPLDMHSYIFGIEQGTHDLLSLTRVDMVEKKNYNPKDD